MSTKSDPVVVGVDGKPASDRALAWAVDEAVTRGCPLHVVNVWQYEALVDWTETSAQREQAASEQLIEQALNRVLAGRTDQPEIVRRSLRGDAAEVLEAASEGAAMLVVASHTDHRVRQMILGSTSMHVVHHAHAPVVVIPVTDRQPAESTR